MGKSREWMKGQGRRWEGLDGGNKRKRIGISFRERRGDANETELGVHNPPSVETASRVR